ncbi:DUF397 domain-containing protein [Streptomyces sp. NPDC019224]|uniref:DUF397 domain-containing protein n=1 Tax=Streptomyces sp. NPDC019224 TaxID=3154484 RepID=UPI00340B5038
MTIRQDALAEWTKSSYSANGNCVEVKAAEGRALLVRDSKSVSSGVLDFSAKTWSAFLLDVTRTARY